MRYEIGYRQKPLSRDEEFTMPYEDVGYKDTLEDARLAARTLQYYMPGCEIRVVEVRS